jgi:hypothetical protein
LPAPCSPAIGSILGAPGLLGTCLFIVTALRQGRNPDHTLEQLKGFCGVWRSTVNRWKHYFRELFPQSLAYRRLAGHLIPPILSTHLPKALLERFGNGCTGTRNSPGELSASPCLGAVMASIGEVPNNRRCFTQKIG